jgi:hypothetical protein
VNTTVVCMTAQQRDAIRAHVLPDDGCEAVAILLCGRARSTRRQKLLVHRIVPVPYTLCSIRSPDRVTWPTDFLVPYLHEAGRKGWSVVKIHGHRGYDRFSVVDDTADRALFPTLYAWMESGVPHGSAILMDDGRLFGRVVTEDGGFAPFSQINVVGDDLEFFRVKPEASPVPAFGERIAQTFGKGTFEQLRRLRVGVVGASGTGSPVIEELARNGVGELVLVDPDVVEHKNLNRIWNSTADDAHAQRPKVEVAARAIAAMGLNTHVETYATTLFDTAAVRAIASCDAVFGCMDTVDGRFLLNKLAAFYTVPYIDLGVKLEADGNGGVDQVAASVHFLKPNGSSLLSRRVFTMEQVRAAGLRRADPEHYRQEVDEGYIRGVQEDRPAVIHVNTLIASLAINELLARVHPFRLDPNSQFATTRISLSHGIFAHEPEGEPCAVLARHVGRGDVVPLLDWPELSADN